MKYFRVSTLVEIPFEAPGSAGSCYYVQDNEPDCIAGRVFARLGVPLELLESEEGVSAQGIIERHNLPFSDAASDILGRAQFRSDMGHAWGEILRRIEKPTI